jgi:formate dehydrogenase maturation protein FdhE
MSDHQTIWLQPWCEDCDNNSYDDRQWSENDNWGQCPDCGAMPVKYVIAPDQPQKPAPETDEA